PEFLKKIQVNATENLFPEKDATDKNLPSFLLSFTVSLLPILLIATATLAESFMPAPSLLKKILLFVGNTDIAMLISLLTALFTLKKSRTVETLMAQANDAASGIALILLIIGGGGAFKEVLKVAGGGKIIADFFSESSFSPLFLAWLVAAIIRIALGSATVAALTAAGMVQAMLADSHTSPELMVLAIGAGSLMCSHVNDTGFWMFKEYFGLTLGQTFRSWTVMETIVGTMGLLGVLVLDIFI
ncbi:MAG: gluconate permease, partial [Verrucomicrobia bacterium]|nr:gluconate permease [Cytophagales bacterium]